MLPSHKHQERIGWKAPGFVAASVVILWGANLVVSFWVSDRGSWGDAFGAVNALFSGLAFAGIFYAILIQTKDLQLQRQDLELTRQELAGQKEALKAQNDTLQLERFENTFFQLLNLHNQLVNGIDIVNQQSGFKTIGRDCFRIFYSRLRKKFERRLAGHQCDLDAMNGAYNDFFSENQSNVGHYFRNLYNLIKFVDRSAVADKQLYTNLVRAQLSSCELLLLFYNCLSELGREKFKPLIEKYALLKTVPREELYLDEHQSLYCESAFQKSSA